MKPLYGKREEESSVTTSKDNESYKLEEELLILTDIPILSLLKLEIVQEVNEHGSVQLSALIRESDREQMLKTDWSGTKLCICQKGREREPLFHGSIAYLHADMENGSLIAEIRGIGATSMLDREKKRRSFQNPSMTYHQILNEVLKDYEKASFIWATEEDREIGFPLIQYEETDWEFIKRLCSHFHGVTVTDMKTGRPNFFFGMCRRAERNPEEARILAGGFDAAYYTSGAYEDHLPRTEAFYLEAETRQDWQMGDAVICEGTEYQVCRRKVVFQNGILSFYFRLGRKGTFYRKKKYNTALAGIRLEGTVRKTEEESVCLQLDIDQEEHADYLWPWAPEINNLCYCMPETGTKASLYLATEEEKDGKVILAATASHRAEAYTNTQNREFLTVHNKRAALYPECMYLEGRDGAVKVSMEDAAGIRLNSSSSLSFTADGKICLQGKRISMTAPVEIVCKIPDSNIELCRDLNFYASGGVRTTGTGKLREEAPEKEKKFRKNRTGSWQVSWSAVCAVPSADLSKTNKNTALGLYAAGSIPQMAKGSAVSTMSQVMAGKKESECGNPSVFYSMENYTVKGGYKVPEMDLEESD